jgi:multicomponent Na+:H+ antiporter subunit A
LKTVANFVFAAHSVNLRPMLIAVLSGFIFAACIPLLGKYIRHNVLPVILPISLFAYFASFIPALTSDAAAVVSFVYDWVPALEVNFAFRLDGLSLLFTLLITGIGSLVFLYSSNYLEGHRYIDRFYGYLGMFMASMLGLVLSDNIITMFIFWELTSISSFFLIGFNNDNASSRKSALTALAVTGSGGLMLLAAFILIGIEANTYSISTLLSSQDTINLRASPLYLPIIGLLFLGAFTKSAQFPFHFWLPGAMKAPTPVSTYLHSATMVKAGVFLLARFTPILGDMAAWNNTLMIIGGATMLLGAFHSVFKKDLKEILAFSTVSALGILVFLIGIGTKEALLAAGTFILVHALYKATLFLITGIIDHKTHTRDITQLGGLSKVMLPVAIAGLLAAISNAGIPPAFGFIGKDLIYEATLHGAPFKSMLTGVAILTNIFLLTAGFLAGIKPFWGTLPEQHTSIKFPHFFLWMPPLLLASLGILFGFAPGIVDHALLQPVYATLSPGAEPAHIKLWHGFNTILMLSAVTIMCGLLLYSARSVLQKWSPRIEILADFSAERFFTGAANGFKSTSVYYTKTLQHGYLKYYMMTILVALIALLSYRLFSGVDIHVDTAKLSSLTIYEIGMVVILLASILFAVFSNSRLIAVAALGGVGYAICIIFVFYSAPDLAMTQFTIDTLSVVLFVLVLSKLPPYLRYSNAKSRALDGMVALAVGALITILALEVLNEPINSELTEYYAQYSYKLAKGKNVVNVILVDFRGIDTMIEITVLSIAAIGVFSLLKINQEPKSSS